MKKCWNHPDKKALYICKICWNPFCEDCIDIKRNICTSCNKKPIKKLLNRGSENKLKIPTSAYIVINIIVLLVIGYIVFNFISNPQKTNTSKKSEIKLINNQKYITIDEDNITVSAKNNSTAESIYKKANTLRKTLPSEMQIDLNEKHSSLFIEVFSNSDDYTIETGKPSWSQGYSDTNKRTIYIIADSQNNSVLTHEMAHLFFNDYIPKQSKHTVWIDEGLAVIIQMSEDSSVRQNMRDSLLNVKDGHFTPIISLGLVNVADFKNKNDVNNWYSQCASIVYYIKETYGDKKFTLLLKNLRRNITFEKSLSDIYGLNVIQLQNNWFKSIKESSSYFD